MYTHELYFKNGGSTKFYTSRREAMEVAKLCRQNGVVVQVRPYQGD
jgi:hypothetical protein